MLRRPLHSSLKMPGLLFDDVLCKIEHIFGAVAAVRPSSLSGRPRVLKIAH
jgi:hypothetical protein